MSTNTDRIQQKVLLRAIRMRVWQAIADSTQFGSWFGVKFDGPFVAGTTLERKDRSYGCRRGSRRKPKAI